MLPKVYKRYTLCATLLCTTSSGALSLYSWSFFTWNFFRRNAKLPHTRPSDSFL